MTAETGKVQNILQDKFSWLESVAGVSCDYVNMDLDIHHFFVTLAAGGLLGGPALAKH